MSSDKQNKNNILRVFLFPTYQQIAYEPINEQKKSQFYKDILGKNGTFVTYSNIRYRHTPIQTVFPKMRAASLTV
jgi:hypothetical protein